MMLLAVPLLLPLLIEAEITKNIPICICILIDKLLSGQRKSRQVQICTVLTKLTYRIGVRGAFIWWRTVIPRFTWFPAECYKTNGTLKDLIVFQWKIKILIQFFFISYALNNPFQWSFSLVYKYVLFHGLVNTYKLCRKNLCLYTTLNSSFFKY